MHAVGAARHVVGFEMFFVADHAVFGDVFLFLRFQPGGEGADVADVFVDGILGFFLCINMILIGLYGIFVDCLHVVSSYAVLIFCPRISGKTGGSYSITVDFDEDNRDGGIGRNWQVEINTTRQTGDIDF